MDNKKTNYPFMKHNKIRLIICYITYNTYYISKGITRIR